MSQRVYLRLDEQLISDACLLHLCNTEHLVSGSLHLGKDTAILPVIQTIVHNDLSPVCLVRKVVLLHFNIKKRLTCLLVDIRGVQILEIQ